MLTAVLALAAALCPLGLPADPAAAAAPRAYGYAVHPADDAGPYLGLASSGGSTTLRTDLSWAFAEPAQGQYDWSLADGIVRATAAAGQRMLLIIDQTPSWASGVPTTTPSWSWYPPRDAATYQAFVRQVLLRYGPSGTFWTANPTVPKRVPVGIEVWNEPNLRIFWPAGPNPTAYTRLVQAAFKGARSVTSQVPVVVGALSPRGGYNDANCDTANDGGADGFGTNPLNFLQGMYAAGLHGSFDAISVHPYNYWGGATAAQMLSYHLCSAWSQLSETPVSIRSLMSGAGDSARQVWATEAGAPSCVAGAAYPCVTEAEQGQLATSELAKWKSWSWAGNYYWYDLRDDKNLPTNPLTDGEQHFGAARGDNSPKPAWTALQYAYTH